MIVPLRQKRGKRAVLTVSLAISIFLSLAIRKSASFSLVRRQSGILTSSHTSHQSMPNLKPIHVTLSDDHPSEVDMSANTILSQRRLFLKCTIGGAFGTVSMAMMTSPTPVLAAASATPPDTIWITGKTPKVPDQKPKDKNDVRGTRKDPNFLRSLADCKNQCENSIAADGYARSKESCLSECQDICCTTYEQCTFGIVPRI